MAIIRIRSLGKLWSTVTVPDDVTSSADGSQQLLRIFVDALQTVPELRHLPQDLEEYTIFWNHGRLSVYHDDVEDEPVFRAEPISQEVPLN